MNQSQKINSMLCGGLLLGAFAVFQWLTAIPTTQPHIEASIGNSDTFISAYDRWKHHKISQGRAHSLSLPLTYVKGLSTEYSPATGRAKLDLIGGMIEVKVSGLSKNDTFDVWLVDRQIKKANAPLKTKIKIGQLTQNEAAAVLQTTLDANELAGFELNRIVVTSAGQLPEKDGLLFGSPTLFQRLYYNERRLNAATPSKSYSSHPDAEQSADVLDPFTFLLPAPAMANGQGQYWNC